MDSGEFTRLTEPYRRELLAHCYRMLGSVHDAEDLVQETYLRAWRHFDQFEGRSSLRAWLYRIATNVCLTALESRGRRALPSGLGGPGEDRSTDDVLWLQPIPDTLVSDSGDPADIVTSRENLRLALIASLQHLPPRQRAVLLLRDVLAWSAAEVAEVLDTTVAAVKSTLQRARARLDQLDPTALAPPPPDPEARALLEAYIAAFENAEPALLERLLRDDFVLELPPSAVWFIGPEAAKHAVSGLVTAGEWRMLVVAANGQPAAAAYRRDEAGIYRAFGIVLLATSSSAINRITCFENATLFPAFGLPSTQPG
jgi:RNA polymerase sigma-70 factor, ECF subfamily